MHIYMFIDINLYIKQGNTLAHLRLTFLELFTTLVSHYDKNCKSRRNNKIR